MVNSIEHMFVLPSMLHSIALMITPSLETNDHQVRVWIDGVAWLDDTSLGLDPAKFFRQSALRSTGPLIVGSCECGVIGCGDTTVEVQRTSKLVTWSNANGLDLAFDLQSYDSKIQRANEDHSWENVNRTAERFANDELIGLEIDGFRFQWASTRIKPETLSMSFLRLHQQRLIEIAWDGISSENARMQARRFREMRSNNPIDRSGKSAAS